MRVAILQPNYIPWKGCFDLINRVDVFVVLDTVQFTKGDWRNRNRIKTSQGVRWLTIPVEQRGSIDRVLSEMVVSDPSWPEAHWKRLAHSYRKAPSFTSVAPWVENLYRSISSEKLAEIDFHFLKAITSFLGIETRLIRSSEMASHPMGKTERLVSICEELDGTSYVTGPAARDYLDESCFERAGIEVRYHNYPIFPIYEQVHPPFVHDVTVLDPIFHAGEHARELILADLFCP